MRLQTTVRFLGATWLVLIATLGRAQPGLKGEYFDGVNFDRKIGYRIDPAIRFNWSAVSPDPKLRRSFYSVRWTGQLCPPVSGTYRFYARVDDGIRIWLDGQKIMDSWQLNDANRYVASRTLEAGRCYALRVDYFNSIEGGEIELLWQRPDTKPLIAKQDVPIGEPIAARYFFQKPAATLPRPVEPTRRVVLPPPRLRTMPPRARQPTPPAVKTVAPSVEPPTPAFRPGATFTLTTVQFEQGSYVLQPGAKAELDRLADALRQNPGWTTTVAGHTDNVGDPRLKVALSENRAKVVANYLERNGVAPARLKAVGYGGTRPIADNAVESERSKNRRVEVTIQ